MTQTDWDAMRMYAAEFCENADPVERPCGCCPGCVARERKEAEDFEAERRMFKETRLSPSKSLCQDEGEAMSVCRGRDCTNELVPSRGSVPRMFCSEKCRKSQYAAKCVDCGEPTSGSEGRKQTPRCWDCGYAALLASGERSDMRRHAEREELIWSGWADGDTLKQIAARVGTSVNVISSDMTRMRAKGIDLPYRRPAGPTEHRVLACQ